MKTLHLFIVTGFIGFLANPIAVAQERYCDNLGFELGNFNNWEGTYWTYSTEHPDDNTNPAPGIIERRHTIMTDIDAYDEFTGGALKKIPEGYNYSARLGDGIYERYSGTTRCWNQSLRYTMTIDSSNALLLLKYALVLEYASDHTIPEEPRFKLTLLDDYGDTIPDCANYDVYATNEDLEGFEYYIYEVSDPIQRDKHIMWRDWTTVGVNLANYIGQTITIDFLTADCTQTYHFGYAYFVAECQPLVISMRYCASDSVALLTAPEGFRDYEWRDGDGVHVGTNQVLPIEHPVENAEYSCTMISETNCTVTLNSIVARHAPAAVFTSRMLDCVSNSVEFTNLSTTNRGTLEYLWDFGDGNVSYEANPVYTFITSGRHTVSLSVLNPPSICSSTLTRPVESFSPPLVGIDSYETYCPGESVTLRAYGASFYEWNTGSEADSILVSEPGGEFSLIGSSSTGCSDTNYITITEEPDWDFITEGDTVLCVDESSELIGSGANTYLWSTGVTSNSIVVTSGGIYRLTGTNIRGCSKSRNFNVSESPPPGVDFSLSDYQLDSRHNELSGSLSPESNVNYVWDMDDGETEAGSDFNHVYAINNTQLAYHISLTATNEFGCMNSKSALVEVVPFVPNVFSPNGDGINDVFMPDLQVRIFDRNGILIYEGTEGWDGYTKGQQADPDTYFYSVSYIDWQEQVREKSGYLMLIR